MNFFKDALRAGAGIGTFGLSELAQDNPFGGALDRSQNGGEFRAVDPGGQLGRTSNRAARFSDERQKRFARLGQDQGDLANAIRNRISSGNTVSGEILRQGLHQNLAAQRSLAAGASPSNSAAAARQAALQTGRLGAGLAGQQALAGAQERLASEQTLGGILNNQRQQELNATLGSRQQALGGFGAIESQRGNRFNSLLGQPTAGEHLLGAIQGGASVAALASDKRLKTEIVDGDKDADAFIKSLKAYKYKYKNSKFGEGEQLGIMAQDLEKSGLGKQAVIETPQGKMVHGAKLAGALAAVVARQQGRIDKLEKGK